VISFDIFTNLNEIINSGIFANVTGTYMVLDANGDRTGATNEPAEDYLFWDAIHPTTKAHENVATEIGDVLAAMGIVPASDGHGSSTCFIDTLGLVSNW
jgi:phospholipase/lecithinase/hemolysin